MTLGTADVSAVFDLLVKLSPAITIVFGLVAAQVQWRRQQRLNAELIAKTHYREMLEEMVRHAELIGRGTTPEGLASLQTEPDSYRRYILLFAVVSFALQEIYFATDPRRNKHWATAIDAFFQPFRVFMKSDPSFTPMLGAVDPGFATFVEQTMAKSQMHPLPT